MQNVQNADIQRVMNLVDLYRTKVGKESQMAKDLAEEYKRQYDNEIDFAYALHEKGIEGYCLDIRIPEEAIDEIRANEQLLGYFYKEVAGDDVDSDVLAHLLADKYDKTIFSDEEDSFLKDHFSDMVNYIIQTPNNNLKAVEQDDRRDLFLLPQEVLDLIKSRVEIPNGAKVYNPFTGLAQFTTLYSGCSFYCEDSYYSYSKRWNEYCDRLRKETNIVEGKINKDMVWPWMKVAIFANQIDAEIIEDGKVPQRFDAVVSYLPYIPTAVPNATIPRIGVETDEPEIINKIQSSYKGLVDGGKMVLILPKEYFWKSDSSSLKSLWSKIIEDSALVEIIQIPAVMGKNLGDGDYCIIIVEKGQNKKMTTLIDARFAAKNSDNMNFDLYLDLASLNSVLKNEGKEESTGLRKMVEVSMKDLNVDLLVPQVYVIERPSENEHPLPLSELGSFASTRIRNLDYDLPEDTPWVELKDLSRSFKGDLDIATLKKADCPNNPVFVEGSNDYAFSSTGEFIDNYWAQMRTEKGRRVIDYRRCTYLDGKKDAVLFRSSQKGVGVAIVRVTNKPIAIGQGIKVFIPKDGVDALTLVSLLKLPVVHRQILTYTEFGLEDHLDDILVPTDKRIIHDEKERLIDEQKDSKAQEEMLNELRKKHIDKLCNYQHGMRKHIREISSAVRRMERYINDMDYSEDDKKYLLERLNHIKDQRMYLSDDIEHLNEDNTYLEDKDFDIDHCLKGFIDYFGSDICPIRYSNEIAKESVKHYLSEHHEELNLLDDFGRKKKLDCVFAESSVANVDISEYNFGKIVRNILENAKKHGFDDFRDTESDERIVDIELCWDEKKSMYRIDFRNNGHPLAEGLSKESYGENRKYAGRTGGSGIGGYEVAENVKNYKGDYEISQDGEWVVISIYLPKSKSDEEERV